MKLWKLRQDRMEYIEKYMLHEFRDWEEEIYNKHIESFNQQEQRINIELENLSTSERNKELEFQMFAKILKNAGKYYEKATNVQKQKICKLLISNLVLINETRLRIMRNPAVNILFWKNSDNLLPVRIELTSNP